MQKTLSNYLIKQIHISFISLIILLINGCSHTKPSQYYALKPNNVEPSSQETNLRVNNIIGIGPIKLPKYLNRLQIIRFTNNNEVLVDDFNRWIEPVEESFMRVLRSNLNQFLNTSYAIEYPWDRAMKVRYQIMLDIHQFETNINGHLIVDAHWIIFDVVKNKKIKVVRKFKYNKKLINQKYSTIVSEQSLALNQLSFEIANEMKQLLKQ